MGVTPLVIATLLSPRGFLRRLVVASSLLISAVVFASAPSAPGDLRYSVYAKNTVEVFWNRATDDVVVTGYELSLDGAVLGVFDRLSLLLDELVRGAT